ncbi:hypothetical protein NDU88_009349 [Pleurodeles waltl]|uniref:Uncharacterized protein n=1 Tax=Pleurodeles waltl TaxID=8319 RepID=A0AAV7NZC0_PLEWA|nr:hypothetical protein NDU88_009349 [Pleurodeles waltl]
MPGGSQQEVRAGGRGVRSLCPLIAASGGSLQDARAGRCGRRGVRLPRSPTAVIGAWCPGGTQWWETAGGSQKRQKYCVVFLTF